MSEQQAREVEDAADERLIELWPFMKTFALIVGLGGLLGVFGPAPNSGARKDVLALLAQVDAALLIAFAIEVRPRYTGHGPVDRDKASFVLAIGSAGLVAIGACVVGIGWPACARYAFWAATLPTLFLGLFVILFPTFKDRPGLFGNG